jgi:hypothetical protein
MAKYTGFIVVAAFLLAILVGVFWNQIIQVDAIAFGVAIIFGVIFLSIIVRSLLYKRIDWSRPNVFVRPFLPPIGSERPRDFIDQNQLELDERHINEG